MKTFYLAHNFYTRKEIRKWELNLEANLNITLFNPFYDGNREDISKLDNMKDKSLDQEKYYRNSVKPKRIVENDLEAIRKSDGLVTVIEIPSIGTSMEIIMAARVYKIPVYVITTTVNFHPWIKYLATKIFKSKEEFEKFVENKYGLKGE